MEAAEAAARLLRAFAAHRRVLIEGALAAQGVVRRVKIAFATDVLTWTTARHDDTQVLRNRRERGLPPQSPVAASWLP